MKVNVERDIDVKQLLINLDSKSQCKSAGMAGYEVLVDKQLLRDAHDVIAQFMKERDEKTLVFAKLEDGTKASGYYSTEEARKALKKTIEKVNKKGVPDCYNCYDDKDLECNNCEAMEGCKIATDERKQEELEELDDFI
jgi:hypothetical protein